MQIMENENSDVEGKKHRPHTCSTKICFIKCKSISSEKSQKENSSRCLFDFQKPTTFRNSSSVQLKREETALFLFHLLQLIFCLKRDSGPENVAALRQRCSKSDARHLLELIRSFHQKKALLS